MRPGRLDRILYVGPPDYQGRIDILRICTRKMAVDPVLDMNEIASMVRSVHFISSRPSDVALDGWLFRGRNGCRLSRRCPIDHATRYQCSICKRRFREVDRNTVI
jgi:SpoVK/Ycf46/Vps4 family AAA+-type ATPase